jgi:hypothetical protein
VGAALVEWGIQKSQVIELPIMTEASLDGAKFYKGLGFQRIGDWNVHTTDPANNISLSIMRRHFV